MSTIEHQTLAQTLLHFQDENQELYNYFKHDESLIPKLSEPLDDWQVSATQSVEPIELSVLESCCPEQIADSLLSTNENWLIVISLTELIMHGADTKAIQVSQTLHRHNPELKPVLTYYLGESVTTQLLK